MKANIVEQTLNALISGLKKKSLLYTLLTETHQLHDPLPLQVLPGQGKVVEQDQGHLHDEAHQEAQQVNDPLPLQVLPGQGEVVKQDQEAHQLHGQLPLQGLGEVGEQDLDPITWNLERKIDDEELNKVSEVRTEVCEENETDYASTPSMRST